MNKLILLSIAALVLVGCGSGYSTYEECRLREAQKFQGTMTNAAVYALNDYCSKVAPKKEPPVAAIPPRVRAPTDTLPHSAPPGFTEPVSDEEVARIYDDLPPGARIIYVPGEDVGSCDEDHEGECLAELDRPSGSDDPDRWNLR